MDYKKIENKHHFLCYKDQQIEKLDNLLVEWCDSKYKNSVLLTYWINDYENFLRKEEPFQNQKQYQKYKRGQILFINFGYRLGSELGGNHYAIVLNNNDSPKSNMITVVPLMSKKNKPIHHTEIDLEDTFKNSVLKKIISCQKKNQDAIEKIEVLYNAIRYYISSFKNIMGQKHSETSIWNIDIDFCESLKIEYNNNSHFIKIIEQFELNYYQKDINSTQQSISQILDFIDNELIELKRACKDLNKDFNYTSRLKEGTIAAVSQITTVSKLRVINPIRSNDTLANVKIETEYLDLINKKLKKLYIYW